METSSKFVEFCQTVATFTLALIDTLQSKNFMVHMKCLSIDQYVQLDIQITYLVSLFKSNFSTAFLKFLQKHNVEPRLREVDDYCVTQSIVQRQLALGVSPDVLREVSANMLGGEAETRVVAKFMSKIDAQRGELEAQCERLELERKALQAEIYELRLDLINSL
jgi:hypothetical protein